MGSTWVQIEILLPTLRREDNPLGRAGCRKRSRRMASRCATSWHCSLRCRSSFDGKFPLSSTGRMDGASRVCSGAHLLRPSRAAARWRPRTRAPRPPPRMHAREMPAARSASAPHVSPLPPLLRSFSCAPTPTRLNIRASSMPRRNRTRWRNWCAHTRPHPPLRAPGRPHAPSPAPACPCAPLRPPPRTGACDKPRVPSKRMLSQCCWERSPRSAMLAAYC